MEALVEEQLVMDEPIEEMISQNDPVLKSTEFKPETPVELSPDDPQFEEDQPILKTVESVPSYEDRVDAILPPEQTSVDSISTPPAVEAILPKPERMDALSFLLMSNKISHETANSIASLPLQESDTLSIAETIKSAPGQLEHILDPTVLNSIPMDLDTASSPKSASRKLENAAHFPVVPEVPAHSISSPIDESDELFSIEPPSEERVNHRQTSSAWTASTDSNFGAAKLPSLDSEFDKDVHPTLGMPAKPEKAQKTVQNRVVHDRVNNLPPVLLKPLHENDVQLYAEPTNSDPVEPTEKPAAPQIDDSSFSTSDDDLDIVSHLAKIGRGNAVEPASRAPVRRGVTATDCVRVGFRATKCFWFSVLGIPNPYPWGSPQGYRPRTVAAPANKIAQNVDVAGKAKSTGAIGQSKVDVPTTAGVQDKTLTASRDSDEKANDKPAIPLDQVNAILTPQEETAMRSLPSYDGDVWLDIIPQLIEDDKQNKAGLSRIPHQSGTLGTKLDTHDTKLRHPAGPKHPLALENGKMESQGVAQSSGVVNAGKVEDIPVLGTEPLVQDAKALSSVAANTQDILNKFVKPAGVVSAGLAGVGAVVGVVWLFEKVKGFFNRKHTKKESSKQRRHVRDWSVE